MSAGVGTLDGVVPAAEAAAPGSPPAATETKAVYDGKAGELFKLVLVNTLLNIVTLGIYRFWAKTRLRHFLWSQVSFAGDRFEYTGRARELLIGFFIVILVLAPLLVASQLLFNFVAPMRPGYGIALTVTYYPLIFFLIGVATFRARRYRLSRTVWRGIRGGQTGSAVRYSLIYMGYAVLAALTLGLALPLLNVQTQRYLTGNTWFGDKAFRYDGRAGELFRIWIKYWLLYPLTLGLSYLWYQAALFRYSASRTRYEALGFRSELRGGQIFLIYLAYSIALSVLVAVIGGALTAVAASVVPSLGPAAQDSDAAQFIGVTAGVVAVVSILLAAGLLGPLMVTHPLLRITCFTLAVTGEQDFSTIAQSRLAAPGRGEGLADAFDVGDF